MKPSYFSHLFLLWLSFSFMGLPLGSIAQVDTSLTIEVVEIVAPRLEPVQTGEQVRVWSQEALSPHQATHLGDLLQQEGGIFIKSYGIGSLATSSLRGGSASHTALLWNGFPINSPMLGLQDLALMPIFFADQVQLHYGGGSSSWGSSAIGGALVLRNTAPVDDWQFSLRGELGNFGTQVQQIKVGYGGRRLAWRVRMFRQQAENNFPFRLRPDIPEQRLQHAALRQWGSLGELYWYVAPRHQFNLQAWVQHALREIPPTTTQTRSEASQQDQVVRLAAHWQYQGSHWLWQSRTGFFREDIFYADPLILLEAPSQFNTFIQELEIKRQWSKQWLVQGGAQYSWSSAEATGYPTGRQQQRLAFFSTLEWRPYDQFQARLAVRQEWVDKQGIAPTPSLGLEWSAASWWRLKAKLSRNFRYPTLNDRYWQPGGNALLQPEEGWSQELTFILQSTGTEQWHFSMTLFNRSIHDWILWSQPAGQVFWSANNITKVWSRGLSPRLEWSQPLGKQRLVLRAGYDWVKSTNQISLTRPMLSSGSQLWYVPEHQGQISLEWRHPRGSVRYQHQFTGRTSGINDELDAFLTASCWASYQFLDSSFTGRFFFQIQNIWNTSYRLIERRPMPGRYLQAGLQFDFISSPSNIP